MTQPPHHIFGPNHAPTYTDRNGLVWEEGQNVWWLVAADSQYPSPEEFEASYMLRTFGVRGFGWNTP